VRHLLAILMLALACSCGRAPAPTATPSSSDSAPARVTLDAAAQKQAGIAVQQVTMRSVPETVKSTGRLVFDEDQTWHIGAVTAGRIAQVAASVGDHVKAGQVLARMHSDDVHEARAAYQKALANLKSARTAAEYARTARDRTARLFKLKAASRQQVETSATDLQRADSQLADAQTEVNRARTHLTEFLGLSLADTDPHSDYIAIRSPAEGIVVRRQVTPGTVVSPGQEAFTVANTSALWLIAAVNEADLSRVHVGDAVSVFVRAYPDRAFEGKVLKLGEELDPHTRSLQVRVLVPNPEARLKPEMYATVRIAGGATRPAIFIPDSAVQEVSGQQIVFVRVAPTAFEPRAVQIGPRADSVVEVRAGLKPGEWIVTAGSFVLKSELFRSSLNSSE
jgi:membrane fusion protein, heavy metal efflux system